ncbi:hypothetical protein Trco_002571 [Trichoderma cornu-damae]|uniref:Uncharacterized protein n=1 Tax=Trichoderma cornu-damae TaxID=654480 RepID=A0A9P8QT20_9HYPO|nr:hypothetical protein Trco_002571 [Trichoderma cornu-damae]
MVRILWKRRVIMMGEIMTSPVDERIWRMTNWDGERRRAYRARTPIKSATQNHRNLTKLAGSHRRRSATRDGPEGGRTLKTSCSQRSSGRSRRRRSRLGNESGSPVHHEVVKMRCVSDRECRRPMWRSFVMRMRNAMATGMAMTMNVQETHAVLWTPVEVKDFGDPNQRAEVVEAIVDEEEEPKVDLHASLSVSRDFAIKGRHGPREPHQDATRAVVVTVAALVRKRVLREGHSTPRNGLDGAHISFDTTRRKGKALNPQAGLCETASKKGRQTYQGRGEEDQQSVSTPPPVHHALDGRGPWINEQIDQVSLPQPLPPRRAAHSLAIAAPEAGLDLGHKQRSVPNVDAVTTAFIVARQQA